MMSAQKQVKVVLLLVGLTTSNLFELFVMTKASTGAAVAITMANAAAANSAHQQQLAQERARAATLNSYRSYYNTKQQQQQQQQQKTDEKRFGPRFSRTLPSAFYYQQPTAFGGVGRSGGGAFAGPKFAIEEDPPGSGAYSLFAPAAAFGNDGGAAAPMIAPPTSFEQEQAFQQYLQQYLLPLKRSVAADVANGGAGMLMMMGSPVNDDSGQREIRSPLGTMRFGKRTSSVSVVGNSKAPLGTMRFG